MDNSILIAAHKTSTHNHATLVKNAKCGCFYCGALYESEEIHEWIDNGDTAVCPYCGVDSVLPSGLSYPLTSEFLKEMYNYWFR